MDHAFGHAADAVPAMLWHAGTDRQCNWFNRPWLEFAGRGMAREIGEGWADRVHPDDLDTCLETYVHAFDARQAFSMEYRMRRHDGEFRWLLDNGAPYKRDGCFAGYWGSCTDVTAHRRLQHDQRVLINELTHRVKNTIAVVQAMAMQSFQEGRPFAEAMDAFEGRLLAMSAAHDLLVTQCWEDVPLRDVIESAVAPHDPGKARIRVGGPSLMIHPRIAMSIAMVVHELLTNAVKYGALSAPGGRVTLDWTLDAAAVGDARLVVQWRESDGPPVCAPARRGFGTRFIERALAGHPGAMSAIRFDPEGVHCTFATPMAFVD